jgi:hypothetical protein
MTRRKTITPTTIAAMEPGSSPDVEHWKVLLEGMKTESTLDPA